MRAASSWNTINATVVSAVTPGQFVVVAFGSGLYAVIVALTGQRTFLLRAVNPHRITWLLATLVLDFIISTVGLVAFGVGV